MALVKSQPFVIETYVTHGVLREDRVSLCTNRPLPSGRHDVHPMAYRVRLLGDDLGQQIGAKSLLNIVLPEVLRKLSNLSTALDSFRFVV